MRILHVAESLPGGIATFLNEALPNQCTILGGDNVYLLAPQTHLRFLSAHVQCGRIPYPRSGRNLRSLLALLLALQRAHRHVRPDVIHAHSTIAGGIVRLWGLMQWRRPTIVYCAHGWAFLRETPSWLNHLVALVERLLARACDGISSISRYEHAAALRAGLPSARCRVIRYGLSPPATTLESPLDLRLDPAKLNFFFIGRHDRQKGLDILLDAFRQLPADRFELYIAGGRVLDKGESNAPPHSANVHYLGWIDADRVDAYYRLFDALIVPSRWEGFGLVVLEAMRNRRAVIASDRGALPEIVLDGITGRIFSTDIPGSLPRCLSGTTRVELTAMGERGYQRFCADFTSKRMNREILAFYGDVHANH
jgi:glycosyltransferase involved in cell wall biosynthesis